jgi:hypothetical protein
LLHWIHFRFPLCHSSTSLYVIPAQAGIHPFVIARRETTWQSRNQGETFFFWKMGTGYFFDLKRCLSLFSKVYPFSNNYFPKKEGFLQFM